MYFRVKAKTKNTQRYRGAKGALLIALAFVLGYCIVVPSQSGAVGQAVAKIGAVVFGVSAYLMPFLILWAGWLYLHKEYPLRWRIDVLWSAALMVLSSSFLSIFGMIFYPARDNIAYGGWTGVKLSQFFYRLFGSHLSLVIIAALFVYVASLLLRVSLRQLMVLSWQKLLEDYELWQEARQQMKNSSAPRIKTTEPRPKIAGQKTEPKIEPRLEPKIITPQIKAPAKPVAVPVKTEKAIPPADEKAQADAIAAALAQYKLPPLEFLSDDKQKTALRGPQEHLANAELLTRTLADFDISARVKEIIPGPVVTRYDMELAPGIKIQAVAALADNIALAMKSPSIRIVSIPEKSAVGVEVPNEESAIVGLKGILSSADFANAKSLLELALGKTTDGVPYVADLAPMPHLLIAGATGSGKSVGIHSIILSILYRARPDEVKFLIIDPKRLEMPIYRGLPHIYDPRVPAADADIITQPKEAAESLKKLVRVMEMRYEKFAKETVRNIEGYNEKMAETGRQKEFYIVVIIDELADLMLIATKEVEDSIQRLAQMARAVGIHLILATQRPSVDVITGVIKANFPARIAFQTTSKVDSRVILDAIGADALLGKGDMLYMPAGESKPIRLQGAFVSSKEAEKVVNFIRQQGIPAQYEDLFARKGGFADMSNADEDMQELFAALHLVVERKRVSQDLLKAHFGSSARATNLLSLLETKGFIHKPEGTNRWTIYFDKIAEYLNTMENRPQ